MSKLYSAFVETMLPSINQLLMDSEGGAFCNNCGVGMKALPELDPEEQRCDGCIKQDRRDYREMEQNFRIFYGQE